MVINGLVALTLITLNIFCRGIFVVALVEFKFDPINLKKIETDTLQSLTENELLDFTERGIESNNHEKSLERNLLASNVVVKNGTISHVQLLDTLPSVEAQKDSDLADEILKSSLYVYNTKCVSRGISGEHCAAILSDIELPKNSLLEQKCRSVINNRKNEHQPLRRLLPRHYHDGFYQMFTNNSQPLAISQAIGGNPSKDGKEFLDVFQRNLAVVQWSQFIANDLNKPVVTTMSNGYPIECCDNQSYNLSPRHHHPACESLQSKNMLYRYGPDTCLNYVRSALAVGNRCTFAPPEQLSQGTAKLDLSQLYGFNVKSQHRMRLHRNGLLKSSFSGFLKESLLPLAEEDNNWFCALSPKDGGNSTCFMAGDSRVNSNPFAIILHTIMMRNHNLIAKDLNSNHPDWLDEKIFQKAKSINIEIFKRIVYNEWLPIIVGTSMVNEIKSFERNMSNDELYQQISNEYAVAASRFFLSMMPNELHNYSNYIDSEPRNDDLGLNRIDAPIFVLKDEIYSPRVEYSSKKLDEMLCSLLKQPAMKLDASYVESLTTDLTNNKRPTHADLFAFDIQRGRDHGLQPYYKYLEVCNNIKITDWKDVERFIMIEDLNKLKTAYASWRDIDLIVGGISELSARNATVGPTFQCIIGEQFSKLRQWDQSEIDQNDVDFIKWRTVTAVDLLCLNSNLLQVPLNIFQTSSKTNILVDCAERLNKLNFNKNY